MTGGGSQMPFELSEWKQNEEVRWADPYRNLSLRYAWREGARARLLVTGKMIDCFTYMYTHTHECLEFASKLCNAFHHHVTFLGL